jgi:hypothetical protein
MRLMCELNVDRFCEMPCSSPMSANTASRNGTSAPAAAGTGTPDRAISASNPTVFKRHRLPARVRPGHHQHPVRVRERHVERHDARLAAPQQQRVAGVAQPQHAVRRDGGHREAVVRDEARARERQVELGEPQDRELDVAPAAIQALADVRENDLDLARLGGLRVRQPVGRVDDDGGLDEQGLAGLAAVVQHAGDAAALVGADLEHGPAVPPRGLGRHERLAHRVVVQERLHGVPDAELGGLDLLADLPELPRGGVQHLAAVVEHRVELVREVVHGGEAPRQPLQRRTAAREPSLAALRGAQEALQVGELLGLGQALPLEEVLRPRAHLDDAPDRGRLARAQEVGELHHARVRLARRVGARVRGRGPPPRCARAACRAARSTGRARLGTRAGRGRSAAWEGTWDSARIQRATGQRSPRAPRIAARHDRIEP